MAASRIGIICEREGQLSSISSLHLCHSLGSIPFQGRHRYYEMIRLLVWHQPLVVSSLGLTLDNASKDRKRSPGIKLNNVPPLPSSLHIGPDRILGVVLLCTLTRTDLPIDA